MLKSRQLEGAVLNYSRPRIPLALIAHGTECPMLSLYYSTHNTTIAWHVSLTLVHMISCVWKTDCSKG